MNHRLPEECICDCGLVRLGPFGLTSPRFPVGPHSTTGNDVYDQLLEAVGIDIPDVGTITVGYGAQAGPATGSFDPATGLGGFSTDLTMTVLTIDLLGGEVPPPCDVVFNLALTGQIDPGTGVLTVNQGGFSVVPPAEDDCGGLGGIMGQLLGGPLNSSVLSFEVGTI